MKLIPYGKQNIISKDLLIVNKSLKQELITTGNFVKNFENKLRKYFSSKYTISCTSGTAALHIALKSIDIKKDDIVIMPAINFISSYNLCSNLRAKIFLADVDKFTGQMTPETVRQCIKVNKLKKVKLIITMYLGGYPENVIKFYNLKKELKCYLLEDACHALGGSYRFRKNNYKIGSCKHSDISIFSLHPLKSITSGEGGVISTNNKNIFLKAKLFRSHGIVRGKNHWEYDIVLNGLNYRLSDINCSLAMSQLSRINTFIKKRKQIYQYYMKNLIAKNKNFNFINYEKNSSSGFHLFLLSISSQIKFNKNNLIKFLFKKKIVSQFHYIPIYRFSVFKEKVNLNNFHGAEFYYKKTLSLPIYFDLSKKNQEYIIDKIKLFFKK
jgi:dTDP-4-amino-4,6-dideoxygalactose transaminase